MFEYKFFYRKFPVLFDFLQEISGIFSGTVRFSGIHKFPVSVKTLPENVCAICRHFRNIWLNGKCSRFSLSSIKSTCKMARMTNSGMPSLSRSTFRFKKCFIPH